MKAKKNVRLAPCVFRVILCRSGVYYTLSVPRDQEEALWYDFAETLDAVARELEIEPPGSQNRDEDDVDAFTGFVAPEMFHLFFTVWRLRGPVLNATASKKLVFEASVEVENIVSEAEMQARLRMKNEKG